ncbi:MAG: hypothetical protein ACYC27_14350 [Armatimonadota bacterium]
MKTNRKLTTIRIFIIALIMIIIVPIAMKCGASLYKEHQCKVLTNGIKVGWTTDHVYDRLGAPSNVARSKDQFLGADRYEDVPDEQIEKEVLEYNRLFWKLYVYIDDTDHVSAVYLVGT